MLSFMPLHRVLMVDIVTAAMAILPLLFIAIPQPKNRTVSQNANLARAVLLDMREGFRYVRAWPGLLAIILVAMALNFILVPSSSLMPLLVTQHFHGGAAAARLAGVRHGRRRRSRWRAHWLPGAGSSARSSRR